MAGRKPYGNPVPVSDLATEILDPVLRKRAGISIGLVQSWEEIAGPRLASRFVPRKSSGRAACMKTIRSSRRCWSSPARAWPHSTCSTRPRDHQPGQRLSRLHRHQPDQDPAEAGDSGQRTA